jgi:23S rRNA pseudouridine1911/1915/1917 synthase
VKHPIVGDPIYGVDEEFASDFLEGKISDDERLKVTKSSRLLLHASRVVFEFNNETFDIHSPVNVEEIFLKEYCSHDKL